MCKLNMEQAYENIVEACENKLLTLYPNGIPEIVQKRYSEELGMLKVSNQIDDFEIFRRISEECQKTSQYIGFRARTSGSFLIYLLGHNQINPLKAHYYCKECGHMEVLDVPLLAVDLPPTKCPVCGRTIYGDGYNLPLESVWGIDGKRKLEFDYIASKEIYPFAEKVIRNIYPDNEIVNFGFMTYDGDPNKINPETVEICKGGYVILPQGRTLKDYEEISSYLEDGEPCICCSPIQLESYGLKKIAIYTSSAADYLMELQRRSGIYAMEISARDLKEIKYFDIVNTRILSEIESNLFLYKKPGNFLETVNLMSLCHNSFYDVQPRKENTFWELEMNVLESDAFQKYPCYTREDFFERLLQCGLERETAYQWSEIIRKGQLKRHPEFAELNIPDELKTVAKMYMYIFPRAHNIEFLLMYSRLAFYLKWNSRVYSAVTGKKKTDL